MSWLISHHSFSDRPEGQEKGFTLIEVLVAISILAIVLSSVYGIFSSVNLARGRLEADSAEYHRARVIFDRLGRELRGAYFSPRDARLVFAGGSASGDPLDALELTTTAVSPLSRTGSGVARVRYRLTEDPESSEGRQVLLRSEQPAYQPSDNLENADMMRLAAGIESMTIRFFSAGQWREEWDSQSTGELPEMVELVLQLPAETEDPLTFQSTIEIPRW